MADRITQLQDYINELATHMCNAIGILQHEAPEIPFPDSKIKKIAPSGEYQAHLKQREENINEHIELFSNLIARTTKNIDIIISSLPSCKSTDTLQNSKLEKLNSSNKKQTERLEELVEEGEKLLAQIRGMIDNLSSELLFLE